jgi:chemotaxis response regulator CheB
MVDREVSSSMSDRASDEGICLTPESSRTGRDVIVIGASAGGVEALERLLAAVPGEPLGLSLGRAAYG